MGNDPMHDQRVREALEACRPGSEDRLPAELQPLLDASAELQDLQRRIERADVRIGAAMHEAPVPEGLAERILGAVAAAQQPYGHEHRLGHRGRRWFVVGGLAALAASVLVAFWLGAKRAGPLDETTVLEVACRQFLSEDADGDEQGQLVAEAPAPEGFPVSRAIARLPQIRWRMVGELLGRRAVAYDFPGAAGRQATLYVFPAGASEVVRTRPASNPSQATGGVCASVWREGEHLYVFVVRGDARDYRRFIYAPSGPLT